LATFVRQYKPSDCHYGNCPQTRFHMQPEIYKHFLEILHTYQREQRTIKQVYVVYFVGGALVGCYGDRR
jgi:hypothetical protein